MRNSLFTMALLFLSVINAQSNDTVYTSPIVHKDLRVTFNIYAPEAKLVSLISTKQAEDIPLSRSDKGLWTVTIGPLTPEIYHYQFSLDGAKITDNKNQNPYPWLEGKSELIIPGTPALLHELTNVPHGSLHDHIYHSTTIKGPNSVRVYTPPGYNPLDIKDYPILFLLHGFGEKVTFWSDFGKVNLIADNLIALEQVVEPIIVMPNGDPLTADYYKFFGSTTDGPAWMQNNMKALEQDLINDLIPFLAKHYKIRWDKESVAIAGSSMGGTQAVKLATDNLDKFGWVIGLSAGLDVPPFTIANKEKINALSLLQLNIGREDSWGYDQTKKVHLWLEENHIKHEWLVSEGGHEWDVWRKNIIQLLPILFK